MTPSSLKDFCKVLKTAIDIFVSRDEEHVLEQFSDAATGILYLCSMREEFSG